MASVAGIFFWVCGLRHFRRIVAHLIEFGRDGSGRGQLLVSIAELGDQLTTHLRGGQARVQTLRFELGIGLALPVDNGSDIYQQIGQVFFGQFAASGAKGIQTDDAAFDFVGPFPNRLAIPAQLSFGSAGSARPQLFDDACHKHPAGTAFELLSGVHEHAFERVRQFHAFPPNRRCLEYITLSWIV